MVPETASPEPGFSCPGAARGRAPSPTEWKALKGTEEGGKENVHLD